MQSKTEDDRAQSESMGCEQGSCAVTLARLACGALPCLECMSHAPTPASLSMNTRKHQAMRRQQGRDLHYGTAKEGKMGKQGKQLREGNAASPGFTFWYRFDLGYPQQALAQSRGLLGEESEHCGWRFNSEPLKGQRPS